MTGGAGFQPADGGAAIVSGRQGAGPTGVHP